MMNATMGDGANIPFTIVCASDKSKQFTWTRNKLTIHIKNIQLVQAPTETLNIYVDINRTFDSQYNRNQCRMRGDDGQYVELKYHSFYVELTCLNYLHEFNKDYKYDVICKSGGSDRQEDEILFSCTKRRLAKLVKSGKRYAALTNRDLTDPMENNNIYFCIRRRSDRCTDITGKVRLYTTVSMFRNTGCDVVLKGKDGSVCTHMSILTQSSEVFRTTFAVEMAEKQTGIVNALDYEKRVINKMLDYLYTGEVGELGDMTESLFKLAHHYELHDLCRRCEEYFPFNIDVDSDHVVEILQITQLYELHNLKDKVVNFEQRHSHELTKLPKYREYLIQSINMENAVNMLLLTVKHDLIDVKTECFNFIRRHYHYMIMRDDFLNLFELNARLMKEIHVYIYQRNP